VTGNLLFDDVKLMVKLAAAVGNVIFLVIKLKSGENFSRRGIVLSENNGLAPLYEALCRHAAKSAARLHIPGHKQGRGLPGELLDMDAGTLFSFDLTELPGLDDLHNPREAIARAQELAAELYGADRTFFLVNGTSAGIQALVAAAAGQGKVIVSRNAHRSVLGGMIISGADPVYVVPDVIPSFGIDCGVPAWKVSRALEEHPEAAAVLAVRPNFYGVAGDLAGLIKAVHAAGRPLLVDEAHGAHLRFHPELPPDAMREGADASVQSTHKLGGSLTQSSMLHLRGGLIDAGRVAGALRLLQTTSPSYLLMASLDLARRQMAVLGKSLLERAVVLAREARERLSLIEGLRVLGVEDLPGDSVRLDPTKLVVSVRGLGLTGFQVNRLLAEKYNVYVEMADFSNIVAFVSIGTTREDCLMLVDALAEIAAADKLPGGFALPEAPAGFKKRMRPRDAWFSRTESVPLPEAGGRICAETVAVYPPGIPALNPGEEITPEVLEYLLAVRKLELPCQGPSDPSLKSVRVVVE